MTTVLPIPSLSTATGGRPGLMPLDDPLAQLLERVQPLAATENVSTFDALGRVLAAEVRSLLDVPPADNTHWGGVSGWVWWRWQGRGGWKWG